MWHESSRAMGVLEGSRIQANANQMKEALVCRESCAADARPTKYEPQDSSLAVLPKSEQQPNAPGLLFWFLLRVREIHRHLRVRSKSRESIAQRFWTNGMACYLGHSNAQRLLLLAKEKSVHFLC